jgi:tetratricopeptide (TPR) repeat protein
MIELKEVEELVGRGEFEQAIELCREAIDEEPGKSVNYLYLGRVYVAAGRKKEAIRIFRDGLLFEANARIDEELARLGWRDLPPFQSLGREHILNRMMGRIMRLFGLK